MFSQIIDQWQQKKSGRSLDELLRVISPSLMYARTDKQPVRTYGQTALKDVLICLMGMLLR